MLQLMKEKDDGEMDICLIGSFNCFNSAAA
jgi:hypothetical protein